MKHKSINFLKTTVLTALILAGNTFAQSRVEQEAENIRHTILHQTSQDLWQMIYAGNDIITLNDGFYVSFEIQALQHFLNDLTRNTLFRFRGDYEATIRIRDSDERLRHLRNLRTSVLNSCRNQDTPQCAVVRDRNNFFNSLMALRNSQRALLQAEINEMIESHQRRKREEATRQEQIRQEEKEQRRQDSIRVEQQLIQDNIRREQIRQQTRARAQARDELLARGSEWAANAPRDLRILTIRSGNGELVRIATGDPWGLRLTATTINPHHEVFSFMRRHQHGAVRLTNKFITVNGSPVFEIRTRESSRRIYIRRIRRVAELNPQWIVFFEFE